MPLSRLPSWARGGTLGQLGGMRPGPMGPQGGFMPPANTGFAGPMGGAGVPDVYGGGAQFPMWGSMTPGGPGALPPPRGPMGQPPPQGQAPWLGGVMQGYPQRPPMGGQPMLPEVQAGVERFRRARLQGGGRY